MNDRDRHFSWKARAGRVFDKVTLILLGVNVIKVVFFEHDYQAGTFWLLALMFAFWMQYKTIELERGRAS